ncbi:MAG: T9SS type A sorting domain-containing protein [Ferruginibacter sp.]|nr:T9SS type A sorting domain-containing protein [Ferruginibacter sp.]
MKNIFTVLVFICLTTSAFSQLTVTSFANNSTVCAGNSTTITASATPVSYSVTSIPNSLIPDYGVNYLADAGVAITSFAVGNLNDCRWDNIAIPFTFRFYGNPYTSVNVSSNGWVGMGNSNSTTTGLGFTLPNATAPNNTVHGVTANLTLAASGTLEYFTDGIAPNRTFVISYQNVPFFSGGGTTTFQIHLKETNNIVEIHTTSCNNTTLGKAQGIENSAGTVATVVTGRNNTTDWTSTGFTNGYRFTPDPINFTWTPATGLNTTTGDVVIATPASTTTYTINATNPNNGATGSNNVTITVDPASFNLAATPGGATVCQNISVAGGGTNYRDGNCNLIATITPSGATPVTNSINTCTKIDINATKRGTTDLYLNRKYDIEPIVNAANATATIKLYYLQSEFDNFNARALDSGHKALPTSPSDVTGIENILLRQFHGTGTNPTNYTGASVDFTSTTSGFSTVWNATKNWWEVTVPVNGFSGFYLSSSKLGTVNIKLNYFTGVQVNKNNILKWRVNCTSDNAKFELQRSTDGISYQTIKSITATKLECDAPFEYIDDNATTGKNYYRLKLIDVDGKTTLSNTVLLTTKTSSFEIQNLYPNPITNDVATLKINAYQKEMVNIIITDISGRMIKANSVTLQIGLNQIPIYVDNLSKGTYNLTVQSNNKPQSIRIFKN